MRAIAAIGPLTAQTTVDSVMALGHAMSKNYAKLAPKVEGRVARYRLQVVTGGDE